MKEGGFLESGTHCQFENKPKGLEFSSWDGGPLLPPLSCSRSQSGLFSPGLHSTPLSLEGLKSEKLTQGMQGEKACQLKVGDKHLG